MLHQKAMDLRDILESAESGCVFMSEVQIGFEAGEFEECARANGFRYWLASDLLVMLGYDDQKSFMRAVNRARQACLSLNVPLDENFEVVKESGQPNDYKMSRFACFLTAMNGNPKNPRVAAAQAYFAAIAETIRRSIEEPGTVERIVLRSEVTQREITLSGVAKEAAVECYPLFQNAGYRGMYNMDLKKLKQYRGVDADRSLLDFMGKTELAANLFRVTQTEEKIQANGIRGQKNLEKAANEAGAEVRATMMRISGRKPEELPLSEDIKAVSGGMRKAHKVFRDLDKKSLPKPSGSKN